MMQPPILPNRSPQYVLAAIVLGIGLMIGWLVVELARMIGTHGQKLGRGAVDRKSLCRPIV